MSVTCQQLQVAGLMKRWSQTVITASSSADLGSLAVFLISFSSLDDNGILSLSSLWPRLGASTFTGGSLYAFSLMFSPQHRL